MITFQVVDERNQKIFEETVSIELNDGWALSGELQVYIFGGHIHYVQAMTKFT